MNEASQKNDRPHLLGLTRAELAERAVEWGFARVHAASLWNELYLQGRRAPSEFVPHDRMPARFLDRVFAECDFDFPVVARETHSSDGFTHIRTRESGGAADAR